MAYLNLCTWSSAMINQAPRCLFWSSRRLRMFPQKESNRAFCNLWERPSFNISSASTFSVPRSKLQRVFNIQCFEGMSGDAEGLSESENVTLDDHLLEVELQIAIESENYARAAKLRDKLRVLQEDNRAGILAANARFYKAFEKGDLSAMRMIWSKGDNVHCIHPGAGCISGYNFVMESWELTFGPELDLPLHIEIQNVEVYIKGNLGFVNCLELVRTSGNNWGKQVATNVFERVNGSWYICVHHASHIGS
eukprot:Gb_08450 [translate_table: standard]